MIKFGTGGWRAIIGEDYIKDNIVLVAQAVANIMIEENVTEEGLVVGYDRRFLSDRSAMWVCQFKLLIKFLLLPLLCIMLKLMVIIMVWLLQRAITQQSIMVLKFLH